MTNRILALTGGILIGMVLHAAITPRDAAPPAAAATHASASQTTQDSRCPKQAIKMPCLFDSGRTASPAQ